jgi:cell division protein FtsB
MAPSSPRRKRRVWVLPFLALLALLFLLSTGKRGFLQQIRVRRDRARIEQEIQRLEVLKKQLEEEKKKLADPAVVEKIAREQYGMAKKNEKVLHVVPKNGDK